MTKQFSLLSDDNYGVRFLHFRATETNGLSKKRTHDNRIDTSFGGVTVAYNPLLIRRKDGSIGVCVEVGAARCSGLDRYVKATGRGIALNNLNSPNARSYGLLYIGEGVSTHEGNLNSVFEAALIPLITLGDGTQFVNERFFDLRGAIAKQLGFDNY